MIRLDSTARTLQLVLAGAVASTQPDASVCYSDKGGKLNPTFRSGTKLARASSATPVTICDAPNAVTIREIDSIAVFNADSASVTATVQVLDSATTYIVVKMTLAAGEGLYYQAAQGWYVIGTDGRRRTKIASSGVPWETPGTIGSTTPNTGAFTALTASSVTATGSILSSGASAGMGFTTGAGSTVNQATSKSTAVTLNRPCGKITMDAAALAAGATVRFALNNSLIATGDIVHVQMFGNFAAFGTYDCWAENATGGVVQILVKNISAGSLSEGVSLHFIVFKGSES